MLLLSIILIVCACSEKEISPNDDQQKQEVRVVFTTPVDVNIAANTRGATNLGNIEASKFLFCAFRKEADNSYSFAKAIKDESATYNEKDKQWASDKSLLAVGTYKFISFYNLGGNESLPDMSAWVGKTWPDIENSMVITSLNIDADEIFCGQTNDIQISGATNSDANNTVVNVELSRIIARLDVKFVKMATDGTTEVKFSTGHSIFGKGENLKSVNLTIGGLSKTFNLGTTPSSIWPSSSVFPFNNLTGLMAYGTNITAPTSTFPADNEQNMDILDNKVSERIIRGAAYFKGAYILPFVGADQKLSKVQIDLTGKNEEIRGIIATNKLVVTKNRVTLITVKLQSTTDPGDGSVAPDGDDLEHLFNPKIKFSIEIDRKYLGVNKSEVEVQ